MAKQLVVPAFAVAVVAGFTALAPTAEAQQTVGEIIVYGTDPCPRATDDEIVVCRRLPESMRYRIPENMRPGGTFQQRQSWTMKSRQMMNVGSTGTGSCSAVGPGGHTGCLTQEIQTARKQSQDITAEDTAPEQ
ncbi:hypothetical protein H9L13_03875 [Sphingomonas lutea]|uniref:Secreted protein n=1 Tax=Sphingomonas lutea TaxID=1045317 RepID=A0A7G9SJM5_9SPHN|nr:hypothetical protein [Sphingomonas lutea]QNN68050.1 hypothetical protein H9L13_03875 [Sphingomonas lutea]